MFFRAAAASIPLYHPAMKPKPALLTALAAVAFFAVLAFPRPSNGQAGATEDALANTLIVEITAQQAALVDNQVKVDERVAAIAEEIRLSRIYVGRAGGKAGGK